MLFLVGIIFLCKQKTAYEMRISDWSSDVCSSDLVLDWYKIQFKDDTHQEYLYNDKWEKTSQRVEEIKIRGEKSVLDTVYYTLQGPVSYEKNQKPADFGMANTITVDYAFK